MAIVNKCCDSFQLLTALKVQLWQLKVIKQTILLQNHWGEPRNMRLFHLAGSSQHSLTRKSPNIVYCTVSISEANTNNVIWNSLHIAGIFSALKWLFRLFNVQVEIHLWAGIDWGTSALLWQRTKLCSWQMFLEERQRKRERIHSFPFGCRI